MDGLSVAGPSKNINNLSKKEEESSIKNMQNFKQNSNKTFQK